MFSLCSMRVLAAEAPDWLSAEPVKLSLLTTLEARQSEDNLEQQDGADAIAGEETGRGGQTAAVRKEWRRSRHRC